jgi:5-azacytidine-induced protein 1
LEDVHKKEMAY